MKTRFAVIEEVRDINEEKRQATFVISTERAVDMGGMREVLRARGCKMERYRKNPVVLDSHNRSTLGNIIGRTVDVHEENRKLYATVEYAPTEKGRQAWELVKGGFVRATSIGYNINPARTRKLRAGEYDGEGESRVEGPASVVDEWELLEVSNVPVPADEDAVRRAYSAQRKRMGGINYAKLVAAMAEQDAKIEEGDERSEVEVNMKTESKDEVRAEKPKVEPKPELGIEVQARALAANRQAALAITPPGLEDVTYRALTEGKNFEQIRKLLILAQSERFKPVGTPEPEETAPKTEQRAQSMPKDITDEMLIRSLGGYLD